MVPKKILATPACFSLKRLTVHSPLNRLMLLLKINDGKVDSGEHFGLIYY